MSPVGGSRVEAALGGRAVVVWVPALSSSGDDLLIVQLRVGHSRLFASHLDQILTASSHVGCCLVVLIFWNFIMVYTGSCAICTCAFWYHTHQPMVRYCLVVVYLRASVANVE